MKKTKDDLNGESFEDNNDDLNKNSSKDNKNSSKDNKDFLKDLIKEVGGEYTKLASEIEENQIFVDTGSYIFNALNSGSIFGGVSGNTITTLAGETSVGKCARGSETITIYCDKETANKVKKRIK